MRGIRLRHALSILAALTISSAIAPSAGGSAGQAAAERLGFHEHRFSDQDTADRTVRDEERRFNYLPGASATESLRFEVDAQGNSLGGVTLVASSQQSHPQMLSAPSGTVAPSQTCSASMPREWGTALFGSNIGGSNIRAYDLDGDGTDELIMGGSSPGGFGFDDFFYVIGAKGPDRYAQIWTSDYYGASGVGIGSLAVGDADGDGQAEIFVLRTDFMVDVYSGTVPLKQISFPTLGVWAMELADVDGDGSQEIVTSDGTSLFVYSAVPPYALEWQTTGYGGTDIAIGNVDADPAPEIVTPNGYVIDGVTHAVQWDYINGFGEQVELADVDQDGMMEIIGAAAWQRVTVLDADIKSPKFDFATNLDIGALRTADTNGDGHPEILVGDGQWGYINCYDSTAGALLWSVRNPEHGVTDVAFGDFDADGAKEVVWGAGATSTGPDYLYEADVATLTIEWRSEHLDPPLDVVAVGDVDDDGDDEIVTASYSSESGYDGGVVRIFNAVTHDLEWRSSPHGGEWLGIRALKIGDVDNDGETEFVFSTSGGYDGYLQINNGRTRLMERKTRSYDGNYFSAIELGDVDGDGAIDIVAGQGRAHTGADGVRLIVFDGATGEEKWRSVDLGVYWGEVYDIELADVDGDGTVEILATIGAAGSGRVYAFDGVTHHLDWVKGIDGFALATANLDGDPELEILVGRPSGVIEVYDGRFFALERSITLGTDPIYGLHLDDIDDDGEIEWLVSNRDSLLAIDGASGAVESVNRDLGLFPGVYNNINVKDVDQDGIKEIVLGSYHSIFQLGAITSSNHTPFADAGGPYRTVAGPEVLFDASGSSDPDGDGLTYKWDFESDGTIDWTSASPLTSHAYALSGHHTATLYISDGAGACASDTADVDIGFNLSPVAEAGGPYKGFVGLPLHLDASASRDPEGGSMVYEWDFDADGIVDSSSDDPTTTHIYATPGRRTVEVRVKDPFGATSVDSANVTIASGGILLTSPNGGETFHSRDVAQISWQSPPTVRTVTILYSRKGRDGWKIIAQGLDAQAGVGSWTVPVVTKIYPKGAVKIVGFDQRGQKLASDTSDLPFTIAP